jgi:hypothetical protein
MDEFSFTLTGVTRQEYFQATRLTAKRLYTTLAFLMVVICAVIILATGNVRPAAFIGPLVIYVIVVAVCEIAPRINYKGQLDTITPITYTFGPLGWTAQMDGGDKNRIKWEATPKMSTSRDCIFLFNNDTSSTMLPRRLMTEEQVKQIKSWYKNTRELSKEYEKKKLREERKKHKENQQGFFSRYRGPAWGPLKYRQNQRNDQTKKK